MREIVIGGVTALLEDNDVDAVEEARDFLERRRTGWRPRQVDYVHAPTLEAWRFHVLRRLKPRCILIGIVSWHPDFADGTLIATTGLLAIEPEEGWARTSRRYYRLGGRQQ